MDLEDAARFFQAHGRVTLTEWVRLDLDSRKALARVGAAHEIERISASHAARTEEGNALLRSTYDDGAAVDDLTMSRAIALAMEGLRR